MKYELNARQIDEIKLLTENKGFYNATELQGKYDVSARTISRDLVTINLFLQEYEYTAHQENGFIFLEGDADEEKRNKLLKVLSANEKYKSISSINSRRKMIYYELLVSSPDVSTINYFAETYFIARSSIVKDLDEVATWSSHAKLELFSTSKGTCIRGKEVLIRNAIVEIISKLSIDDLVNRRVEDTYIDDRLTIEESTILLSLFDYEFINDIKDFIALLETKLGYVFSAVYYFNLVCSFLVSCERIKMGRLIRDESDMLENFSNDNSSEVYKSIYKVLKEKFNCNVNEYEAHYLYKLSNSAGIGEVNNDVSLVTYFNNIENVSSNICNKLLCIIEEKTNAKINRTNDLFNFFLLHINSLINRLKYNIKIQNLLSNSIVDNYSEDYRLLEIGFKELEKELPLLKNVNEDEICYLVPYVHAMLDESKIHPRVLIICVEGIGLGKILSIQIRNKFPNIDVIDSLARSKLNSYDLSQIDLVISTVKIDMDLPIQVVTVSPLLNDYDVNNVQKAISGIKEKYK